MSAIKSTELKHTISYYYRIHGRRIANLQANGLSNLSTYLNDTFDGCHKEIFESGPSSSTLKFDLGIEPMMVQGHRISKLAKHAEENYLGAPHDRVEACALDSDEASLAVEVPIWLKQSDLIGLPISQEILGKIFAGGEILTGHIDLLALEDGNIWIWDYKPRAHKERYAATQLFFYALMLAKRTKLSLERFRCGYFDEKRAYLFKPDLSVLK